MAPAGESPNVLLVTVDCLRRDRLSAYGYHRRTTPFLDSLIDDSLHATAAHATAPWTAPSVASLLTGMMPWRHGAGIASNEFRDVDVGDPPSVLRPDVPALPQLLDFASAAFLGVWTASLPLPDRFDLMRLKEKGDTRLAQEASDWLCAQDGPSFCWLHLGDPHDPLDVPRGLRDAFGPTGSYRTTRRWAFTGRSEDPRGKAFEVYREARQRLYDAAVLASDRVIEDLWRSLGEARDRTILVVTADHGEEMWDHLGEEVASFADPRDVAGVGHGHTLFQELLLVPLILHGPGVVASAVEHPVSLVDLVPTLLEATGRPTPGDIDGHILGSPPRPIGAQAVAYGYEKRAVVDGACKLVVSEGDRYERAFLLDPAWFEGADAPEEIDRLRALLPPEAVAGGAPATIEGEMEAHLRDLGYLE